MASASDVATVRRNVNESTDVDYGDEDIALLVDAHGVAGTTAGIWREKAAKFADLVNVSESGASHSYSDLHKAALSMAARWEKISADETMAPVSEAGRVHCRKIVRS